MGTWMGGARESCLRSGRSAAENLDARDPESVDRDEAKDTGSSIPYEAMRAAGESPAARWLKAGSGGLSSGGWGSSLGVVDL